MSVIHDLLGKTISHPTRPDKISYCPWLPAEQRLLPLWSTSTSSLFYIIWTKTIRDYYLTGARMSPLSDPVEAVISSWVTLSGHVPASVSDAYIRILLHCYNVMSIHHFSTPSQITVDRYGDRSVHLPGWRKSAPTRTMGDNSFFFRQSVTQARVSQDSRPPLVSRNPCTLWVPGSCWTHPWMVGTDWPAQRRG